MKKQILSAFLVASLVVSPLAAWPAWLSKAQPVPAQKNCCATVRNAIASHKGLVAVVGVAAAVAIAIFVYEKFVANKPEPTEPDML